MNDHVPSAVPPTPLATIQTTCCIVGGGPAGTMLALLLARRGVPVVLLEAHMDFDREFRGDTIHPSVMEVMDELGLAERLLHLPHTKLRHFDIQTSTSPLRVAPFQRLSTRFRYITMMPQTEFLTFVTQEAQQYPYFRLIMGAKVDDLIIERGVVAGVRFTGVDGRYEVRARLVVGADGRFSKLRKLVGIEPIKTSPPIDLLWFKLPRQTDDPEHIQARIDHGQMMIMLNRFDYWQCGYLIPKGSYGELHAAGLDALRHELAQIAPVGAERMANLQEWKQISLLSIESSRCPRWYTPGLLLIGDAAHVMSPVGGVGINYAIMDAVAAANMLAGPLHNGTLTERHLRAVQRRRELPTRLIQTIQTIIQRRIIAGALNSSRVMAIPPLVRWLLQRWWFTWLPGRMVAFGFRPEHARG